MQLRLKSWLLSSSILIYLLTCHQAVAQIIPDNTLPNNSVVPANCTQCQITGGTTAGNNLFHSFAQFTIPTGNSATFNNTATIENIISRVTGNLPSEIDGRISANGIANVFLINPNGIIFGPNAVLRIGGSFLATTAESINFADGTQFSATNPQTTPLLTVSLPAGLQFGQVSGGVSNQSLVPLVDFSTGELIVDERGRPVVGGLQVVPGRTLALVGGDITLDNGYLTAPGGRIELGGLSETGTVGITFEGNNPRLDYPNQVARADISLINAARADASGQGSGAIQVQGRRIQLTDGAQIRNYTSGSRPGGTLSVTATESIDLIGVDAARGSFTGLTAEVRQGATGSGSNITIKTQRLTIQDGARISTATRGQGAGGNLEVNASESVELIGTQTPNTTVLRSALFAPVTEGATGDGGNLTVETRRLSIRNGATVDASTFGEGNAGDLTVRASESVELSGISADPRLPSNNRLGRSSSLRIETRSNSSNPGDAGNLRIETRQLTVRDGARVSVSSSLRGGNTGNLEIAARSILLDNQGNIQATLEAANQGNISLGNIRLDSQSLVLRNGSFITTNAQNNATGGNITINTGTLVALENSDISANAQQGSGGRIVIDAQGIFGTEFRAENTIESDITASSTLGPQFSGIVEINSLEVDLSYGLVNLPEELVDAATQIAQGCTNNSTSRQGKFVMSGRGGLPPTPDDILSSDAVLTNWATLGETEGENISRRATTSSIRNNLPTQQIVEAQGWIVDANGKVFLTAQVPNVTPNNKLSTNFCNGS